MAVAPGCHVELTPAWGEESTTLVIKITGLQAVRDHIAREIEWLLEDFCDDEEDVITHRDGG
jgi:hypothetical protein